MRIWDDFLTDRDRADLAAMPPPPPVVLGRSPALLLIDLWASTVSAGPAMEAIARARVVLQRFRDLHLPVLHTTMAVGEYEPSDWYSATREASPAQNRTGDRYAIADELLPSPGEVLIHKTSASAFWGTSLLGALQAARVDTIVVCGESTSGCVRASVVDAASYRYRVAVVEDCVYDRHQASHAINLFDMHQKYAAVLPSDELLKIVDERWSSSG
jgi:maleamate amidohydrolase